MISTGNAKAIGGGLVAAAAIVGATIYFAPQSALPADDISPSDAAVADAANAISDIATSLSGGQADAAAGTPEFATGAPTIDTFFRSPDATTVLAGTATPGTTLDVLLAGDVIGQMTAGSDGAFGTVLLIEDATVPRRLRVIADPKGDAIGSAQSIIVPPVAAEVVSAEARDDTTPSIESQPDDQIAVSDTVTGYKPPIVDDQSPTALSATPGGTPNVAAPPTLIADADGIRIIPADTGANDAQPELTENVALDAITYDPAGEVLLSGRADAGGFVQIYLDNTPITVSRITEDGEWKTDLPDVDTGVYTLRVDEVDGDGVVQSRIETPFKREEPGDVAAILADETSQEGFDIAVKTVQPGATLWAIAEEQLGNGILYVSVFEANRDLIRNPDLIYPGQVFRIPQAVE